MRATPLKKKAKEMGCLENPISRVKLVLVMLMLAGLGITGQGHASQTVQGGLAFFAAIRSMANRFRATFGSGALRRSSALRTTTPSPTRVSAPRTVAVQSPEPEVP